LIVLHLEGVCELEVCEVREVVDEGDESTNCDTTMPQAEVQEGVLKSGIRSDLSKRWEEP